MGESLVIVRHHEPLAGEEMAAVLRRVYGRLFDAATLERLTRASRVDTIGSEAEPGRWGRSDDESGAVRTG